MRLMHLELYRSAKREDCVAKCVMREPAYNKNPHWTPWPEHEEQQQNPIPRSHSCVEHMLKIQYPTCSM